MPKLARNSGYLFRKNGSPNWSIRLQRNGKDVIKSLGTSDKLAAEALAAPIIGDHKTALLAARPRLTASRFTLEPGQEHIGEDGAPIIATAENLIFLDHDRKFVKVEPNSPADKLENLPMGAVIHFGNPTRSLVKLRRIGPVIDMSKIEHPPTRNGDDAVLETYIKHANVSGHFEREARVVWALFKTLTNGKALRDCDRDDGRKLVAHFEAEGLKSATIQKKLMWANAACNLAIREGRLKFNPFSSVVPKRDDKVTRLPLSDADVKACKGDLDKLSESDQLLFRVLATTGMRLSEAFEVDGEEKERGCRFVIVGKKTEQSLRRVPLPAGALPFLPDKIKGPLFAGTEAAASKRLNRFLRDCGIADPRKVLHSLRHRAQDRLRAAGCPQDVRWALLGHEEKTVAAGYGEGFPVTMLREWVNKIGF